MCLWSKQYNIDFSSWLKCLTDRTGIRIPLRIPCSLISGIPICYHSYSKVLTSCDKPLKVPHRPHDSCAHHLMSVSHPVDPWPDGCHQKSGTLVQEFLYRLSPVRDDTSLYRAHEGLSHSAVHCIHIACCIHNSSRFIIHHRAERKCPALIFIRPGPAFPGEQNWWKDLCLLQTGNGEWHGSHPSCSVFTSCVTCYSPTLWTLYYVFLLWYLSQCIWFSTEPILTRFSVPQSFQPVWVPPPQIPGSPLLVTAACVHTKPHQIPPYPVPAPRAPRPVLPRSQLVVCEWPVECGVLLLSIRPIRTYCQSHGQDHDDYLCFRERLWPTMEDQRQYCLKWNNHPTNISSVFDRLRSEELFVDVTLASQDRQVSYELWVRDLFSSFDKVFSAIESKDWMSMSASQGRHSKLSRSVNILITYLSCLLGHPRTPLPSLGRIGLPREGAGSRPQRPPHRGAEPHQVQGAQAAGGLHVFRWERSIIPPCDWLSVILGQN